MKTYKEINELAQQWGRDNPDATPCESYQRGYIDAMKCYTPTHSYMQTESPAVETECFMVADPPNVLSFEYFWNAYDYKQDRRKCEKKWNALSQSDKMAIMEHVPRYVASTPDKKFRRHPATYLNNRSWENEIINHSKPNYNATAREQELNFLNSQAELIASLDRKRESNT